MQVSWRPCRCLPAIAVPFTILLFGGAAWGHPLSQGTLEVLIHRDRVLVRASVTQEEVSVTDMLTSSDASPAPQNGVGDVYQRHARYLAAHIHVAADGKELRGTVQRIIPPAGPSTGLMPSITRRAVYELEYPLDAGAAPPQNVTLRHDVLTDSQLMPGTKWEATYVVRIAQEGHGAAEGLLLTAREPLEFPCDWTAGAAGVAAAGVGLMRLAGEYLRHGIHHILTGYDHLLFISALVLATTRFWDLVRVVTAFTLAHTITLTLAALKLVHLPEGVVEPLIAGSIVFVAVQNVFWPKRTRGWGRLGAAFFFGLFHGLGFAGGLLEAMQDMGGWTVLVAIACFSLGVEIGHQMIVLPLFGGLKIARRTQSDMQSKEQLSIRAQRLGSAAISLAGLFYLVVALRLSFAAAP